MRIPVATLHLQDAVSGQIAQRCVAGTDCRHEAQPSADVGDERIIGE